MFHRRLVSGMFLPAAVLLAASEAEAPGNPQRQQLRAMQQAYRYSAIARAYATYMIEHGRDVYGTPSPLFVSGIDRHTGTRISPPFPHVKRKPFMPGLERDRECRPHDRNQGHADPLDQLILLELMHRLAEITGDRRYAGEADKTAAWWMEHAQTKIGLYPWGTHTHWDVNTEGGGGTFEFNRPWPYWKRHPDALQRYARGLWDHYVRDKETGDFNRHAHSNRHGPGGGMEFPWPGASMIATWTEAYLAKPDPAYKRAIATILNRWESLRDPTTGRMAPCSSYQEWVWYEGYAYAANILDDSAALIQEKEPGLAEKMRNYGRRNDTDFLSRADQRLDVKRIGLVMSYRRDNGRYNTERPDILGGPWQDRKHYAGKALLLYGRGKRTDSHAVRERFRQAVLDTAEVYMSINPEVQWAVWGANMSDAIELMFAAYDLTGNAAYMHRAEHFGRLCVDLFLDESSPLPKITSHDDFYEIERVTGKSTDAWMRDLLELDRRLDLLDEASKNARSIVTNSDVTALSDTRVAGLAAARWHDDLERALTLNRGGVWDCTTLRTPAASVALAYGKDGDRELFLSRRTEAFDSADGLPVDRLELIASDCITKVPSLADAERFNGAYRRGFSGKHQERSTARYGGFKDVLHGAGLLLANRGAKAAKVAVTATCHDTWHDNETKEYHCTLQPGERVLLACAAPDRRFIRRFDLTSTIPGAVKLEQFVFLMTPRNQLTRPSAEPMKVDVVQGINWQDHHFAMTNWFYKYKWSEPATHIKILAACGYDGVMLSLKDDPDRWKTLPAYLAALKKHTMRLTAIHARFYIEDGTYPQVIKDNLPLLKDTRVVLIPSVGSRTKLGRNDPKAVEMAVEILHEMSNDAEKYGLGGIAPYMHIGNWIETIDDSVRIAKAVDRRNVGVMFHLHHWQAVGNRDLEKLREDLTKAKPYLMVVVIQGTDKDSATHKILGEGTFDMVPLVRVLAGIDYQGPLGTMGYTQRGDIPGKLDRAYKAWQKIKGVAK